MSEISAAPSSAASQGLTRQSKSRGSEPRRTDHKDAGASLRLLLKPHVILYTVVALAPLPFGSNDPVSVSVWCLVLSLGLMSSCRVPIDGARTKMILALGALAGAFGLAVGLQVSTTVRIGNPDPIWAEATVALETSLQHPVTVAQLQPIFALGHALCFGLSMALAILVGADRLRARRLLDIVAWSGAVYAAYGIVSALTEPTMLLWIERPDYIGNVIGTFVNRNTAATYFGCVASCWLLLLGEAVRRAIPAGRMSWASFSREILTTASRPILTRFAGASLCLMALLMTSSRAGVIVSIGAMTAAIIALFWNRRPQSVGRVKLIVGGALTAIVLLQILGGAVNNRFDTAGLSDENRFDIYRATIRMIADHPWLGTGLGTFPLIFPSYRAIPPDLWGIWTMAHSTPLETAAEMGLPVTALLGCGLLATVLVLLRGFRIRRRDKVVPLIGVTTLGIAVLHSCIDFSLQIPGFAIVAAAIVGTTLSQSVRSGSAQKTAPRTESSR